MSDKCYVFFLSTFLNKGIFSLKNILSFYDNKIFDYDFFIDSIKNELDKKESYLLLHHYTFEKKLTKSL
jgi:hypothetical protein